MSDGAVMHRLATGEIPRPDGHTGMGTRLEKIVAKATATAPDDRYPTALELQRELTAYIGDRWGPCSAVREIGAALAETFRDERERNQKLLGSGPRRLLVGARRRGEPVGEEREHDPPWRP